jgi:GDP-mannose 6-dehydrogenase
LVGLGTQRIGIFGLAFKQGTDDLRESPIVELAERLLGRGFDLKIYDPAVSLSNLVGANREYIERRLPHLAALLTESADAVMEHAEAFVIAAATPAAAEAVARADGRTIVDLVRLPGTPAQSAEGSYLGVAW